MFRDVYDRFFQQIYHTVTDKNEIISHYLGGNYSYSIDYKSETKKTTEQDTNKMTAIIESMIDTRLKFEKEAQKINVKNS